MAYANGKRALAECDRCGFTYLLNELKKLTVNQRLTNTKVCRTCWEPDHPQWQTKHVTDNEALRDPRPDRSKDVMRNVTWGWAPVYSLQATGQIGKVSVT